MRYRETAYAPGSAQRIYGRGRRTEIALLDGAGRGICGIEKQHIPREAPREFTDAEGVRKLLCCMALGGGYAVQRNSICPSQRRTEIALLHGAGRGICGTEKQHMPREAPREFTDAEGVRKLLCCMALGGGYAVLEWRKI